LRAYFAKGEKLESDLASFDGFWVMGGNVFVLRQAFALSSFDNFLLSCWKDKKDIVYG
jgi:sRNA-binding regulator protein Hfq